MPLILLLDFLGFHLEKGRKPCRLIHLSLILIPLLYVSHFIRYRVGSSVVVATIAYITARCIHFTLIIIYIRNMISRKSRSKVFKHFDKIDLRLETTFNVKIKGDDSKCFMLLVLFLSAFSSVFFECYNDKSFNVGQLVHAMLVFILSVKILYYCMLCASIKVRYKTLIKYLRDKKSSQNQTKLFSTENITKMSQIKEISSIYDETLEIILLLNEEFSTLLSFSFGELWGVKVGWEHVVRYWDKRYWKSLHLWTTFLIFHITWHFESFFFLEKAWKISRCKFLRELLSQLLNSTKT